MNTRGGRYAGIAGLGAAAYKRAESLYRRAKRDITTRRKARKLKENPMNRRILGRPLKRPRSMAPPTTTSARVSARYAVANRMTKFKKAKPTQQKVPKSAITHYKEFGQFATEKCMYINHEHWGSFDKLWYGIALGLAKKLLPMAKIYNGKLLTDPCIGPRTDTTDKSEQYDDKSSATVLRLVFFTEAISYGNITKSYSDIAIDNVATAPDEYLSMDAIAKLIEAQLRSKYVNDPNSKTYLAEAQFRINNTQANQLNAMPIYIQNLDDAEIHLYVNSLIKFQNVTTADHGTATGANPYDKSAIDANPLIGRVFTGKGYHANIDSDLLQCGDNTLDSFFGDVSDNTGGITLCGHANTHTANDLGRISSIPRAAELYGNQAVSSGQIRMAAGAMKFHKTSFTLRKTFKELAGAATRRDTAMPGRHTLFGLTLEHKHGEDSIKVGYNRDIDVGCYISHKRIVHPIKTQYTLDSGVVTSSVVPTEHAE